MKKIVIIGAGGFGREVIEIYKLQNKQKKEWKILGFIDDDVKKQGKMINGFPVLGNIKWFIKNHKDILCVCAIADPLIKKRLCERLEQQGVEFTNAIDPSVRMSDTIGIGKDVIICSGCILTVNIELKNHIIININSTVGHDSIICNYSSIMPGTIINGNNIIEEGVYIGTGAKFIQDIIVGCWSIVGAGAVVTKNIPAHVLAVGIPAIIKKRL